MRKILIALSTVILALFFILVASNQINAQEGKKAATEVSKNCGKCPEAAKCEKMAQSKECAHAKCDHANKEACCKAEGGKECKHQASAAKAQCCEMKAESKTACQKAKCPMAAKE